MDTFNEGIISSQLNDLFRSTAANASATGEPDGRMRFSSTQRDKLTSALRTRDTLVQDAKIDPESVDDELNQAQASVQSITQSGIVPVFTILNPNDISFKQGKRYTRQDTMGGTDWHHFADPTGRNNDVLDISFRGNTGDLYGSDSSNPARSLDEGENKAAFERLKIFHGLHSLTLEEMIFEGRKNVFSITYQSLLFPLPLIFYGFYKGVMSFSENGKKPKSRDYSFDFTVTDTNPKLYTIIKTLSSQSKIGTAQRAP